MAKEANAKKETKKTEVKKQSTKKTVEPEKKVTAETINTKLQAVEAVNNKKQLAENKRLYNRYIKQIDSAYKRMEGCYLDTAFALHSIYQNQLYKIDNYKNIYDFAKDKYGIARGTCNNFINICERFGIKNENGNISQLAPEYENYGTSQLIVMLTFPTDLLNKCDSKMSVRTLKELKAGYLEEEQIAKSITDKENESSPMDMLPDDDITGGDSDIPMNEPVDAPTKWDIGKNEKNMHICTVKSLDELLKMKEVIEEALKDIVDGNKKKNACIEVNIVF